MESSSDVESSLAVPQKPYKRTTRDSDDDSENPNDSKKGLEVSRKKMSKSKFYSPKQNEAIANLTSTDIKTSKHWDKSKGGIRKNSGFWTCYGQSLGIVGQTWTQANVYYH